MGKQDIVLIMNEIMEVKKKFDMLEGSYQVIQDIRQNQELFKKQQPPPA